MLSTKSILEDLTTWYLINSRPRTLKPATSGTGILKTFISYMLKKVSITPCAMCHQVYIACRRISEDIKSGSTYLKALYDGVAGTNGTSDYFVATKGQFTSLTKDSFINLFLDRKIVFVLAVLDTAVTDRNIIDVQSFDSNVAKFSLNELVKSTRAIGATFQVCQIQK
jgi:hypothetical protein